MNPITTLGSMQVHISYAKEYKRQGGSIADLRSDLYSQYGGLYYGIHRLMMYPADYENRFIVLLIITPGCIPAVMQHSRAC